MYIFSGHIISNPPENGCRWIALNSECAICHVVRHGNVNSIQYPFTVTESNNGSLLYSDAVALAVLYNVTNRKLTYIFTLIVTVLVIELKCFIFDNKNLSCSFYTLMDAPSYFAKCFPVGKKSVSPHDRLSVLAPIEL